MMFSMYLTTYDKQSRAYFGGYNQEIVDRAHAVAKANDPNAQPIYWLPINSGYHWQVSLYKAKVGNQEIFPSVKNLIFDTGASLCYLDQRNYRTFITAVRQAADCYMDSNEGLYYCRCSSRGDNDHFPTLSINIGTSTKQHWFYLRGKDYLFYQYSKRRCAVLVDQEMDSDVDFWLMGDPFLRAYYSIYDMEKN